jgi:hypothetical protein
MEKILVVVTSVGKYRNLLRPAGFWLDAGALAVLGRA